MTSTTLEQFQSELDGLIQQASEILDALDSDVAATEYAKAMPEGLEAASMLKGYGTKLAAQGARIAADLNQFNQVARGLAGQRMPWSNPHLNETISLAIDSKIKVDPAVGIYRQVADETHKLQEATNKWQAWSEEAPGELVVKVDNKLKEAGTRVAILRGQLSGMIERAQEELDPQAFVEFMDKRQDVDLTLQVIEGLLHLPDPIGLATPKVIGELEASVRIVKAEVEGNQGFFKALQTAANPLIKGYPLDYEILSRFPRADALQKVASTVASEVTQISAGQPDVETQVVATFQTFNRELVGIAKSHIDVAKDRIEAVKGGGSSQAFADGVPRTSATINFGTYPPLTSTAGPDRSATLGQ